MQKMKPYIFEATITNNFATHMSGCWVQVADTQHLGLVHSQKLQYCWMKVIVVATLDMYFHAMLFYSQCCQPGEYFQVAFNSYSDSLG